MPEAEITSEQVKNVREWIYTQPLVTHIRNLHPGIDTGLWLVNDEPLAITEVPPKGFSFANIMREPDRLLVCSLKHAVTLTSEGLVNFNSKESETRTS